MDFVIAALSERLCFASSSGRLWSRARRPPTRRGRCAGRRARLRISRRGWRSSRANCGTACVGPRTRRGAAGSSVRSARRSTSTRVLETTLDTARRRCRASTPALVRLDGRARQAKPVVGRRGFGDEAPDEDVVFRTTGQLGSARGRAVVPLSGAGRGSDPGRARRPACRFLRRCGLARHLLPRPRAVRRRRPPPGSRSSRNASRPRSRMRGASRRRGSRPTSTR